MKREPAHPFWMIFAPYPRATAAAVRLRALWQDWAMVATARQLRTSRPAADSRSRDPCDNRRRNDGLPTPAAASSRRRSPATGMPRISSLKPASKCRRCQSQLVWLILFPAGIEISSASAGSLSADCKPLAQFKVFVLRRINDNKRYV
ncbi:MAG: hypothetical protein WCV63_03375 [Negativicutes bacterium]